MDVRSDLLGTPLGQFGLGALALVVGGALLFSLIGAVSSDEDDATPTAADTEATPRATDAPDATATGGTDEAPTDGATADPTDAPTDAPPTEAVTATEPTAGGQFDPGDITIQVLDAAGDGGAARDAVVACLEAAGFDDLITNSASRVYTNTTVFYTPGEDNQTRAQQSASAIGVASVEEKPSNLSESVPVHIVVGEDGERIC